MYDSKPKEHKGEHIEEVLPVAIQSISTEGKTVTQRDLGGLANAGRDSLVVALISLSAVLGVLLAISLLL